MNLITDRTLADVKAVQELAETIKRGEATEEQVLAYVSSIQKGAYTHEDLNRVENAVQYVAGRLVEFGYLAAPLKTESWTVEDKPNADDFARYLHNVALLRDAITVWKNTPEAPLTMVGFDVDKANALEQILIDIDQILDKIRDAWLYLGDLYLAEV